MTHKRIRKRINKGFTKGPTKDTQRTLQSWSKDMESQNAKRICNEDLEDLEAVVALDLVNAYGNFNRSGALAEVREYLPQLMGMVKSQWQHGNTTPRVCNRHTAQHTLTMSDGLTGSRLKVVDPGGPWPFEPMAFGRGP